MPKLIPKACAIPNSKRKPDMNGDTTLCQAVCYISSNWVTAFTDDNQAHPNILFFIKLQLTFINLVMVKRSSSL